MDKDFSSFRKSTFGGFNRKDVINYIEKMRNDDLLIITADHGCDPSFTASTDHTREYTPCIIYSKNIIPEKLSTRDSFADIAATVAQYLNIVLECDGTPMPIKFKR